MTSFTSLFGVTSYVRLLNCYMGHRPWFDQSEAGKSPVDTDQSGYSIVTVSWSGSLSRCVLSSEPNLLNNSPRGSASAFTEKSQ